MSATKNKRAKWTCRRKVRHDSESAAWAAARALRRKKARVEAYKCPVCPGWHVGHAPANVRQSRRDQREKADRP